MNYEKDIRRLINAYSIEHNKTMIIEECSELIKAITKDIRGNSNARDNILEELVDVTIMIDIAKEIYCISDDEFNMAINHKMEKNINRCIENNKRS